ncbi:MAG: TRAP transporter permease [Hyphomicrobiaceae bacterium]
MSESTNAQKPVDQPVKKPIVAEGPSERRLSGPTLWLVMGLGLIGILLNINRLFNFQFGIGLLMIDTSYYYLLTGIFLALVFLVYPAHDKADSGAFEWIVFAVSVLAIGYVGWKGVAALQGGVSALTPIELALAAAVIALLLLELVLVYPLIGTNSEGRPPWFDWVLFVAAVLAMSYLSINGEHIVQEGWDIVAPPSATIIAGIVCLLVLEAMRRVGGPLLFLISLFFFLYPLYADQMPGFLWGPSSPVDELVRQHALGTESIIGVPMRTVAGLLIGFLLFGSALVATGGGEFFMTFATALLGRARGGPAKVAILSSGLFGSLSGSVISNVVTTGQLTIPTMKRVGYPAKYAAAVEACASTGGALMPPVMGAVAFIMAEYLNISYATVMIAATVPALMFYIALLLQADCYAAKNNLKGQPASEIPALWPVVKVGWHYLLSLVLLIYLLVWVGIEAHAPFYATLALITTSIINGWITGVNKFKWSALLVMLDDGVKNITNIVGILAGIGLIVGALSYTGVGGAFSRELVQFAGGNIYLLLFFGAVTSFILGMGMTVSACYIFLAVVMGPAMINAGLDPVASHLFILYWGVLSFITPPVALGAIAASTIAGSKPMQTGFLSMRLGLINFILPFLFVLNPTLILRGDTLAIIHNVSTALIAVWLMAASFEGYLHAVGRIGLLTRILLLIAAGFLLVPGVYTDIAGAVAIALAFVAGKFTTPSAETEPAGRAAMASPE